MNMKVEKPNGRIDRKSSIELEPRTLSFRQIEHAREAALFVINTRSAEDAMNIFTEGLEPVLSVGTLIQPEAYYYDDVEDKLLPEDPIRDAATAPF